VVNKLDYKIVGLTILFLLCWMGYFPLACSSAVVWSDDFSDGNDIGWATCENDVFSNGSEWSAAEYYLRLVESDDDNAQDLDWGIISHPSEVAYGTWSFDFRFNETQVEVGTFASVMFISNYFMSLDAFDDWITYWVYFEATTTSEFTVRLRKNVLTILDTYETLIPVAGWHSMNVTRDTDGLFKVYHNGDLIMQAEDTGIDSSELFSFAGNEGAIIDNVVVYDEVHTPTTTPTTTPEPIDWLLVAAIGASAVVILAVLVLILKRR
jgi:hypothetical protein